MNLTASPDTKQRKHDEFLQTITSIFTIAKWFGIPAYGNNAFLCLAILILLMLTAIEAAAIWKLIRAVAGYAPHIDNRGVITRFSGAVFYGNTVLSLILSWRLIRSWKYISIYWLKIETKSGLYFQPDVSIKRKVTFVSGLVAFCACVEHMLSMMSATGFDCQPSEYFVRYILSSHRFMLLPNEYSIWVGIPIFIVSKIATILWNFQDLIVILISMGLTSRYHRLNLFVKQFIILENRMKNYKNSLKILTSVMTWRRLRIAYVHQADLVRKVNKELGTLILLCSVNNFFFICLQLFLGLRKVEGAIINQIYYFVSLGWLLVRSCCVLLAAADVNFHSQSVLPRLCECPSSGYNIEVKRLKYHIINDEISLSGMGLFYIKRPQLLKVAAAIVKYELILIQFD